MEEKLDTLVIVDALYVYQVFQSHKKGRPDFVKMHHWVKTNLAKEADQELKPKYYYITSGLSDKTPVMKKLKKYYIVPELSGKNERSKCPKCSHKLDWGRQPDVDTEIALCLLEHGLLDPSIKTIVLFAGDGDFYRLLTRIVADSSKTMIVVGDKSSASSKLQSLIGKNYIPIPYEELVFSKATTAAAPAGTAAAAGGKGKYKLKGAGSAGTSSGKSYQASGDFEDEDSKMEDEEYLESLDDSLESGEEETASGKTSRAASFGSKEDEPKYLRNSIMKVEAVLAKPKKSAAESRVSRATSVPIPAAKPAKKLGGAASEAYVRSMAGEDDTVMRTPSLDEEEDSMESVAHIAQGVLKMLDFEQFQGSASSSLESSSCKLAAVPDRKHSADELLRFSRTEFSRDVSLASSWTGAATWTSFPSSSLEDLKKSKVSISRPF